MLVDDLRVGVRIDPDDREGGVGDDVLDCLEHTIAAFVAHRPVRRPTSGDVSDGEGEGEAEFPDALPQLWPIRSIPTNTGAALTHCAQVRIGICDFKRVPGLICDRPCGNSFARSGDSRRSIVAALFRDNNAACSSVGAISLSRRSNFTRVGNIGARILPAGARGTAQRATYAGLKSWQYVAARPVRGFTTLRSAASRNAARASSRCHPADLTNSSRIYVFRACLTPRYVRAFFFVAAGRCGIASSIETGATRPGQLTQLQHRYAEVSYESSRELDNSETAEYCFDIFRSVTCGTTGTTRRRHIFLGSSP